MLECFESGLRHGDEGVTRVDKCELILLQAIPVEADIGHLNNPGRVARSVDPELIVTSCKELRVVASKPDLRWILGRVPHVSVHTELFLRDHSMVVHLFEHVIMGVLEPAPAKSRRQSKVAIA